MDIEIKLATRKKGMSDDQYSKYILELMELYRVSEPFAINFSFRLRLNTMALKPKTQINNFTTLKNYKD